MGKGRMKEEREGGRMKKRKEEGEREAETENKWCLTASMWIQTWISVTFQCREKSSVKSKPQGHRPAQGSSVPGMMSSVWGGKFRKAWRRSYLNWMVEMGQHFQMDKKQYGKPRVQSIKTGRACEKGGALYSGPWQSIKTVPEYKDRRGWASGWLEGMESGRCWHYSNTS